MVMKREAQRKRNVEGVLLLLLKVSVSVAAKISSSQSSPTTCITRLALDHQHSPSALSASLSHHLSAV